MCHDDALYRRLERMEEALKVHEDKIESLEQNCSEKTGQFKAERNPPFSFYCSYVYSTKEIGSTITFDNLFMASTNVEGWLVGSY